MIGSEDLQIKVNYYFNYNLLHILVHPLQSQYSSRNVFSKIFLASQKPCLVFPNEFGPDDVGVSRPIFLIRIRHSAGISSGSSSSLSLLNAAATVIFFGGSTAFFAEAKFI